MHYITSNSDSKTIFLVGDTHLLDYLDRCVACHLTSIPRRKELETSFLVIETNY